MTILILGAVISVSPHNISSFSASWMKVYWACMCDQNNDVAIGGNQTMF